MSSTICWPVSEPSSAQWTFPWRAFPVPARDQTRPTACSADRAHLDTIARRCARCPQPPDIQPSKRLPSRRLPSRPRTFPAHAFRARFNPGSESSARSSRGSGSAVATGPCSVPTT
jgi:hypothetical protein